MDIIEQIYNSKSRLVLTMYGWGKVLKGPVAGGGQIGYMIKLTENSFCPHKEILFYNIKFIKKVED